MTATAQPQIQLEPLEWAIVAALRDHGSLTTVEIRAHIAKSGFVTASLRQRLHTLTRFCVLVREARGIDGKPSRYRLRVQ